MTNKQTILVAGATGNIGGGVAVALAKLGARVVLLGRRLEKLEARADSIRVDCLKRGSSAKIRTLSRWQSTSLI